MSEDNKAVVCGAIASLIVAGAGTDRLMARRAFVPRMSRPTSSSRDGSVPLIVLEDLGDAHRPPPRTPEVSSGCATS